MSTNVKRVHTLEAIANWQLDAKNAEIGLPALRRGYVWKPKQVETLWDSLLRGFPIGSFLVADSETPELKKDLLDGQQRATAIAMGFFNPWETNKNVDFFSSKFKNVEKSVPVLWLDIGAKDELSKGEKGDFIFLPRLVTQSHPWGYRPNGEVLSLKERRSAKEIFDKMNCKYPCYNLKEVYPWEAGLPIPIAFLISVICEYPEKWKSELKDKCIAHLSHIQLKNATKEDYFDNLQRILDDLSQTVKIERAVNILKKTKIPTITLEKQQLEDEANTAAEDSSTLLIRINTSGTRLEQEELIYSMYKTAFPKSKEIVEEAGTGFIPPSRIITLMVRIVLTDISAKNQEFRFAKQLNFKQFKSAIKDKQDQLYLGLKGFYEGNNSKVKDLFAKAKALLIGEKDFQLPFPLAVDIAKGNADILFILLYWLHKSELDINDILSNEAMHKKILGAITTLHWFALDTNKFLSQLAKEKLQMGENEFWNSEIFNNAQSLLNDENKWLTFLAKPDDLRNILERKINCSWEQIFEDNDQKNEFLEFFHKLNWQRSLLLFAQRRYIRDRFTELQWDTLLEDANRPYDWDHIYPDNYWTYNIPNFSPVTKDWRWSIGNFRALALEDNRAEGARWFPKQRLENTKDISFITSDNWFFWEKIDNVINEAQVEILAKAIIYRVVDIYEEWYSTLGVGELFGY